MKNLFNCIIIILLFFSYFNSFAQEKAIIKGKVIDGQSLYPLPFANIAYSDNQFGTSADKDGYFELPVYKYSDKIIVSYVGYKTIIINTQKLDPTKENLFSLFPIDIFLQEVTVFSNQNNLNDLKETNGLSVQSERIKEISAAMPDILRSVQALPGIAVNNEFKANFNVRGGNQDENLVLVNGAQIYEPYHIKEAANASVGIFNVDLIKEVDLITGGFSARYGDKMSSVLNLEYREGNKKEYRGAASLSLAYADAFIEGPISDKSSFILGVRKSYMEYVLKMIEFDDINTAQPSFYDIQGVVNYDISPSHKLLFEFIHAGDAFTYKPDSYSYSSLTTSFKGQPAVEKHSFNTEETNDADYYSNLFDVKSINVLSNKALLNIELSYYSQKDSENRLVEIKNSKKIGLINSPKEQYFDRILTTRKTYDSLNIETAEIKSNLLYQFTPNYEVNLGFSFKNISYKNNFNDLYSKTSSNNIDAIGDTNTSIKTWLGAYGADSVNTESYKYNMYIENIFQISDNFVINLGGRLDYFDINKDINISPRINFSYAIGKNTVLRSAWGYYYQSPDYRQLKSSISSDTNTIAQKAIHYILGLEKTFFFANKLDHFFKFKIEGYYKDYTTIISSWYGTFERLTYSKENDAIGNAKGLDLYLVLNLPGFYSWLSYGLLYANENNLKDDKGEYPRYTDQRHTLSFISNIDLGSNWDITLKAFYGSGFPYTPKIAEKVNDNWKWIAQEIHSKYLPAYKRIDFRISKAFNFSNSTLSMFIDVSNVFNFKNIQFYEYAPSPYSKPTVEEKELWPILPSFGIRWSF